MLARILFLVVIHILIVNSMEQSANELLDTPDVADYIQDFLREKGV